jgi:hypothetical protein
MEIPRYPFSKKRRVAVAKISSKRASPVDVRAELSAGCVINPSL